MDPTTISVQRPGDATTSHIRSEKPAPRGSSRAAGTDTQLRQLPAQWLPQLSTTPSDGRRPGAGIPAPTTVLVADPLTATRAGLCGALSAGGIGRVIEVDSVHAVDDVIASGIDGQLALVSLGFGDAAYRLIHRLRRGPWQRVIALATNVDPDPLIAAVQAGASGVLRGRPGSTEEVPGHVHRLTAREIEVLTMVADGRSNKWIAERLSLSALTVKSHLARISRKLGTGDRSHLVAIAMRAGAIS
jgi:DNA-binding NarL/FixJ family response regulator